LSRSAALEKQQIEISIEISNFRSIEISVYFFVTLGVTLATFFISCVSTLSPRLDLVSVVGESASTRISLCVPCKHDIEGRDTSSTCLGRTHFLTRGSGHSRGARAYRCAQSQEVTRQTASATFGNHPSAGGRGRTQIWFCRGHTGRAALSTSSIEGDRSWGETRQDE
jgi:hypothetical protein